MNHKLLYVFMSVLIILILTKFIEKYFTESNKERKIKETYTNMDLQSRTGIQGINSPFIFEKKYNYNHYTDKNKQYTVKINENILFYNKDEYAKFNTDSSGNQYITVKNKTNNKSLILKENNNNSKEYDKFYVSYVNKKGNVVARLIRFKDHSYGIEVKYPSRKVIYRSSKINVPSTQYFGSVGTIMPMNDYNYSYSNTDLLIPDAHPQPQPKTKTKITNNLQKYKIKGLTHDQIQEENKDLYILKTQIVPPLCPICSTCPSCKNNKQENVTDNTNANSEMNNSILNNNVQNIQNIQMTSQQQTKREDLCIKCPHCPECNIKEVKQPKYIDFYKKDNISLENTVFPKFSDFDTANMTINKYLEKNMYNNEFIPVPKLANFHNF